MTLGPPLPQPFCLASPFWIANEPTMPDLTPPPNGASDPQPSVAGGGRSPERSVPQNSSDSIWNRHDLQWALWAGVAAFGCYFCMYAFRKPFTAAGFKDAALWGIDYKVILVTAQVFGYTLSKFLGIKIIAEMQADKRGVWIVGLVSMALAALVGFGLAPRPWNAAFLFLNGLPLGMIFGLVLGYLEGRRLTEALTAMLCISFIAADGVTKSVGTWLLNQGVPEDWMPAAAGSLFLLPLCVCVWMLKRIPLPTQRDVAARTQRQAMNRADRFAFLSRFGVGIAMLATVYLLVTILRSVRADFGPEIWVHLGGISDEGVFTRTELWVSLGVLLINGSAFLIANNRGAFFAALLTCGLGLGLLAVALVGLQSKWIDGFWFMVLVGLGLYLPYVAFHTTVFERMLAMTRQVGNIGFLMYVVDATGYLGYVGVMVAKNFTGVRGNVLDLLISIAWTTIVVSGLCLVGAAWYFSRVDCPGSQPSRAGDASSAD